MNKKLFGVILAFLIAGTGTASAKNLQVGEFEIHSDRTVSVKVTVNPGSSVAMKVISADGKVRAIDEKKTNSSGIAEFSFVMPQSAENGLYSFDVGVDLEKAERFQFNYIDTSVLLAALNEQDLKADGVIDLLAEGSGNTDTAKMLGFDMDSYNAFTAKEKQSVAENFLAFKKGTAEEDVKTAFMKATGTELAKKGNVKTGLLYYNPTFEGKAYNDLESDIKNEIVTLAENSIRKGEDLEKAYETAMIVLSFKNAKSSQVGDVIKSYGAKTGIANSSCFYDFNAMTSSQKERVYDAVAASSGNAKTYSDIVGIFEEAVRNAPKNQSAGGGSGGGGSVGNSNGTGISKAPIPAPAAPEKFSDLNGFDWARSAILSLAEKNVISGYEDGTFKPQNRVKREEFVKMAVALYGMLNQNAVCEFDDVEPDKWYAPYVASGVEWGIIYGVNDSSFGIGEEITRQDMAVIVYRMVNASQIPASREYTTFADEDEISEYAKESVKALYEMNIINGMENGKLCPTEKVTRAQAAKVLADVFSAKEDK